MRRAMVAGLGVATLAAGALVASPRAQGADGAKEETRRVQVVRLGGGSRLGVRLEDVDKDDVARLKLSEERGALVRSVDDGSPADKAGLKRDDVIVRFQGEAVTSATQLARLVRETPAGRSVAIEVSRAGSAQKLMATLAEAKGSMHGDRDADIDIPFPPEPPVAPKAPTPPEVFRWRDRDGQGFAFGDMAGGHGPRRLGIEYQDVAGQFAQYLHAPVDRAVVVTNVDEGSAAAKAGLKAGDLILRFGGKEVRDGNDLRAEVQRADAGKELVVSVQRDGKALDLKVTLSAGAARRSFLDETM